MATVMPKAKRQCFEPKKTMESAGTWCLIESDPGVFTQLIHAFGASGVQVEELWTVEEDIFENLRPVHGLIFLFKYQEQEAPSGPVITSADLLEKIYFARQTVTNACATQAIISLLLNCEHPDLELGMELTKLKEFSRSFDPQTAGNAIGNSQVIRAAHNSMGNTYVFEVDNQSAVKDDEVYHFIGYMPIEGRLYELDGLRAGPIDHGPIAPDADWLDTVRPIIRARINKYTEGEIHFNLMALVSDRKTVLMRQMHDLVGSSALLGMETDEVESEVARLRQLMDYEEVKMQRYEQELARRRHNYLPFIMELLSVLAEGKKNNTRAPPHPSAAHEYAAPHSVPSFESARACLHALADSQPDSDPRSLLNISFSSSGRYAMPPQAQPQPDPRSLLKISFSSGRHATSPQPQPQSQLEPDRTPKLGRPARRSGRGRSSATPSPRRAHRGPPFPVTSLPRRAPRGPLLLEPTPAGGPGVVTRQSRALREAAMVMAMPMPVRPPPVRQASSEQQGPPASSLNLAPAASSPVLSEASRASQSSPSNVLSPGGDIGYTLADLDSIYRDHDSVPPPDAPDTFAEDTCAPPNLADDSDTQEVDVEGLSPESFAQASLSQDSLDVILPAQMLNSNIFDIPDFPDNFLENLDDETLNQADANEPDSPSPGDLVIDCPNASEDQPEIEDKQKQPEVNNAPELILHNRPPPYVLQLPADNVLGINIFDNDSDDNLEVEDLEANLVGRGGPQHNNILELNIYDEDTPEHDANGPNIFDENRPEENMLEQNYFMNEDILEPNTPDLIEQAQNAPLENEQEE